MSKLLPRDLFIVQRHIAKGHQQPRIPCWCHVRTVGISEPGRRGRESPRFFFRTFNNRTRVVRQLVVLPKFQRKLGVFAKWLLHNWVIPSPLKRLVSDVVGADNLHRRARTCPVSKHESNLLGVLVLNKVDLLAQTPLCSSALQLAVELFPRPVA